MEFPHYTHILVSCELKSGAMTAILLVLWSQVPNPFAESAQVEIAIGDLCRFTNCSRRTAQAALTSLGEIGILKIQNRKGYANTYRLTRPSVPRGDFMDPFSRQLAAFSMMGAQGLEPEVSPQEIDQHQRRPEKVEHPVTRDEWRQASSLLKLLTAKSWRAPIRHRGPTPYIPDENVRAILKFYHEHVASVVPDLDGITESPVWKRYCNVLRSNTGWRDAAVGEHFVSKKTLMLAVQCLPELK